jgi:RNA polymerase sigma-70 factor (ECF subfamily)
MPAGVHSSVVAALNRRLEAELDAGFVDLVDEMGGMVLSVAARVGDPSSAEEIAQETFLRAYRWLSSQDGGLDGLEIRPWLASITMNLVRNEYRRRGRRPTVPLPERAAGAVVDRSRSVEEQVLSMDATDRLARLLTCLPPAQREAIVLRHVAGLTTAQTATVMDCPTGTVKSHLARGLATLRSQLTEPTQEPT